VESILAQTYPHFDLLVLDNNSTDNTVPWLKTLTDARIRLQTSASSLSMVDSWARITSVPRQEFMTIIGHDDTLDPGFLAAVKDLIDRHPDAGLYQTGFRFINPDGQTIRYSKPVPEIEKPADYLRGRFEFQRDITGTGYVTRSADYDRVGGIPPFERLAFADDALWLSLMSGRYKAAEPSPFCAVRHHPKKESVSIDWSEILVGLNRLSDFVQSYVENDAETKAAAEAYSDGFMLAYHRNLYIRALVDASHTGGKVSSADYARLVSSLKKCAPAVGEGALRHSLQVRIIEMLTASPLRVSVPHLWSAYHRFKYRARKHA
jgi:glycosyltransferase involved in cell wall biosynthesis